MLNVPRHLPVAGDLLAAVPASAQDEERLPWFAVDLHGASVGMPTAEGWIPVPVIGDTPLPGRGFGIAGGATVYPLRLGIITFGAGVSISAAKGKGESLTITTGSGATAVTVVTPIMRTAVFNVIPQLSINFGHKLGWSYLSAGLGTTRVTASMDAAGTTPQVIVPETWNSGHQLRRRRAVVHEAASRRGIRRAIREAGLARRVGRDSCGEANADDHVQRRHLDPVI